MACGNGEVDRDGLGSQPETRSPLREIAVKLPRDSSSDRLKADVWTTGYGEFKDKPGVQRKFPGVNSGEGRWKFKPDDHVVFVDKKIEPYTHMTGRAGWLGPESLLSKLPADVRKDLEERRVIVLGKSPEQTWVNERDTTVTSIPPGRSKGYDQKTVVRPAQVIFKKKR